ncbi:hypothetical protein T12_11930 [Trichinella patagoniensis]|uniref:Integrase catalytic domain-containing protein n=1 Tax=Trichinella patagoniensis TaxID=990121 RepID=A0A0V1ADH9_9BILA|nr:hypothetical protein T12_11930 [Trichinella patagoniensis]
MERFFSSGYARDVKNRTKSCLDCSRRNPPPFTHSQRTHPRTEACKRRFQKIKMDSFSPLPRSEHGNRYIFLITDCFTKYGMLQAIHTDQGSQFESACFTKCVRP